MTFSFSERQLALFWTILHTRVDSQVRRGAKVMSRVAVITGGASGMGLASAQRLAAQGHKVALLDLDADAAVGAAKELRATGATAIGIGVDVSDRPAVDAAMVKVRAELGPIEIIV